MASRWDYCQRTLAEPAPEHEIRQRKSALVTSETRTVFRSESAKFYIFVQLSKEMWAFDDDGSVNRVLPEICIFEADYKNSSSSYSLRRRLISSCPNCSHDGKSAKPIMSFPLWHFRV